MVRVPCRLPLVPSAATRPGFNLIQTPVPARVSAGQPSPRLAISSCHHRGRRVSAPKLLLLHFACTSTTAARCLTPRSSGAPTAGHQARSGDTRHIFASPGLAPCRYRPLSSNVRQRKAPVSACRQTARPSGLVFTHSSLNAAGSLPLLPGVFGAIRPEDNLVHAPVPARVSAGQPSPRLAITAGHHRGWRVSAPKLLLLHFVCTSITAARCLTPRSSGAPTAGHQARSGGTRYIFASPGLASCRRCPLSSNVRHQKAHRAALQQEVRLSAWTEQPRRNQEVAASPG